MRPPIPTHAARAADARRVTLCEQPIDDVALAPWGTWPTCTACVAGIEASEQHKRALGLAGGADQPDMSDTRTKARMLLAAATHGPDSWRVDHNEDGAYISEASNGDPRYRTTVCQLGHAEWDERNAALIAAAPTLIATLCDEVDAAVAERGALRAVVCIDCGGTGSKRPNVGSTILYPPGTHCDKCGGSGAVIIGKGDK